MLKLNTHAVTRCGMMAAVALILSYVESLIPVPVPVPGIKIGLANMAGMVCFYLFGFRTAWIVTLIRIILSAVLFGNIYSLSFSMAGGLLSLLIMSICIKTGRLSITGVSIAGAVSHNIGQIVTAALTVNSAFILSYVPVLLIGGIISGIFIGILSGIVVNRIKKEGIKNEKNKD